MRDNNKPIQFLSNLSLSLKKKVVYRKKADNVISKLKTSLIDKQANKKLSLLVSNSKVLENLTKRSIAVVYIIHFYFSSINTFLYVTDSLGNLKFIYSAGLVGFKGKQKKSRPSVLKTFFKELRKLKTNILKNKVVSVHLTNVGFYKYFIIKKLKKLFLIRFIKSYQLHSYNGCRKRKRLRKK